MKVASQGRGMKRRCLDRLRSVCSGRSELPPVFLGIQECVAHQGLDQTDLANLEETDGQPLVESLADEVKISRSVRILEPARVEDLARPQGTRLELSRGFLDAGDDGPVVGDRIDHS